jgi:hypothetical protein
VQPCVRPVCAVHMTAGHNSLRGSGPGQKPAFDNALARVGCPDRRIDRLCITCCSPSQPSHRAGSRRDLVTPRVRRVPCSAFETSTDVRYRAAFVQVFGRRNAKTIHALRRPASEKRQGTKSRGVGHRGCRGRYGDYMSGALSSQISVGDFLPCFCAFFCSTAPQAFFRPDRRFRTPACAEAIKVGRRSGIEAHFDVSRPRLDSFEHGGRLDGYGPEERSVVEFFLTSSLFASGCLSFAGSASMSMSRAMIASAYIRQLRSGLPLCCMHGRSRR